MKTRIFFFILAAMAVSVVICSCGEADTADEIGGQAGPAAVLEGQLAGDRLNVEPVYAVQVAAYHTALAEQWDTGKYLEHDMSDYGRYCSVGDAGYTMLDLDNDGSNELLIGAIKDAESNPVVFEIWTQINGEAVRLCKSMERDRYYLSLNAETGVYIIANEASGGAANSSWLYYTPADGELTLVQGVVYDGIASPKNPWFVTSDTDWDISNDTPVDEDTAQAIIDSYSTAYIVPEYTAYSEY